MLHSIRNIFNIQYILKKLIYSFLIISNDLTKDLKVDEIKYDENASLNFLFLFIEFFSGAEFGGSIHDFNKTDYEFLVKLYQFIESSDKDPIHLTLDLFKLLGLIKDASMADSTGSRKYTWLKTSNVISEFDDSILKKYKGILHHKIISLLKKPSLSTNDKKQYKLAFVDIMQSIFKSEGLSGLYSGVKADAGTNERLQYVYANTKYREILNLAGELVKYNKLDCKDVIQKDNMDFDFRIESGETTVETQRHILAQKYQTFFKIYVESITSYLEGIIKTIIDELQINRNITTTLTAERAIADGEVVRLEGELVTKDGDIQIAYTTLRALEANRAARIRSGTRADRAAAAAILRQINLDERLLRTMKNEKVSLETQLRDAKTNFDKYNDFEKTLDKNITDLNKSLYDGVKSRVLGSIANDLTFVYDDGKSFFTDTNIAQGFLDFIKGGIDITTGTGFERIRASAHTYDKTIKDADNNDIPNPRYYAASVVTSLSNTFDIMADDTIESITDHLKNQITKSMQDASRGNNNTNVVDYTEQILTDLFGETNKPNGIFATINRISFKTTLENKIYKERFLKHILTLYKNYFKIYEVTKRIDYEENISGLHPLIQKLMGKDKKCHYYKSFIINYDTCEQLYRTKFLLDTEKFLAGVTNTPPRKLGNPMNRLKEVVQEYLGLRDNPVWILSKENVYLSMPDTMSLINTSLLSKVPKTELMNICKIKASDYWNEQTMGKITQLGNKSAEKYSKKIKEKRKELEAKRKEYHNIKSSDKFKRDSLAKKIDKIEKEIDALEEKRNVAKIADKNIRPNAFLFSDDDPSKAENMELLSQSEIDDLAKNKNDIRDRFSKLNPHDDSELSTMTTNQEKIERSHPMDFEDVEEKPKIKETEMEELIRLRKEFAERNDDEQFRERR